MLNTLCNWDPRVCGEEMHMQEMIRERCACVDPPSVLNGVCLFGLGRDRQAQVHTTPPPLHTLLYRGNEGSGVYALACTQADVGEVLIPPACCEEGG
jgi:tRNA G18 (ribose-2'-O)-methylase SpoU